MVRQIHQEYVKAGAEILETNTFGANRMRLAAFGLASTMLSAAVATTRVIGERPIVRPFGPWLLAV
jgi:homocysteine S-methyltransferase